MTKLIPIMFAILILISEAYRSKKSKLAEESLKFERKLTKADAG